MARVYIEFSDLSDEKRQEVIEAYEEEGIDPCDLDEVFYCQFDVDSDGDVSYE